MPNVGSPSKKGKDKGREKPLSSKQKDRDSNTEMPDVGQSSKKNRKGKMHKETPSSEDRNSSSEDGDNSSEDRDSGVNMRKALTKRRTHKWNPRETKQGKKIFR
jgi:hypothetical protein